ncbi:MAG: preprotein translocase subunit SecG, partial [Candidatus Marinimicrobia bacterium]|nr:preprotein translocase subunit SecG [Candidatus Neomarinimicrobiota bacterium]
MYTFLIILHVLVSLLLTLTILMQSSKGGGLS